MTEIEKIIKAATEEKFKTEEKAAEVPTTEQTGEQAQPKKSYGERMRELKAGLHGETDRVYAEMAKEKLIFVGMLDTASHFLRNSVGNIMLIYAQNPEATELHTYEGWKERNKTVKKGSSPVYVLKKKDYTAADGTPRTVYDPEPKYDILDTVDGKVSDGPKYDEKTLVRGLVHACPAKIIVDANYPQNKEEGAAYIKDMNEVRCKFGMPIDELVPTVINAAALATYCCADENSRESDYHFKSRSIAYLLTKKYGISTENIQIQSIPSEYASMDSEEFKGEIEDLLSTAKKIDERVAEVLFRPREQSKTNDTKTDDTRQNPASGKEER